MEDRVHFPHQQKAEFVGGGEKNLFDFKWTFSSRGKFTRRVVEIKVLVSEPDLISNLP